jgi:hypothetical protein
MKDTRVIPTILGIPLQQFFLCVPNLQIHRKPQKLLFKNKISFGIVHNA